MTHSCSLRAVARRPLVDLPLALQGPHGLPSQAEPALLKHGSPVGVELHPMQRTAGTHSTSV